MSVNEPVLENALIEALTRRFARSPLQLNGLQESDAELVRLPGSGLVLAVTTDSLVEEIETGLYADPHLIGWMTVLINASDLAAVGAEPLGIVLNQTLPPRMEEGFLAALQAGIDDACRACALPVLGGDTNFSPRMQLGATAVGLVSDGQPITRKGCRPGDRLFASGPLGLGSAFAFYRLRRAGRRAAAGVASAGTASAGAEPRYLPQPRLREGQLLRRRASAAMDTSDGAIPALDQLMRLNGVGFDLDGPWESVLHEEAATLARAAGLPPWMLLAGPHGEFELLFTVPPDGVGMFQAAAGATGWRPVLLGQVTARPGLRLLQADGALEIDTTAVRNLPASSGRDIDRYLAGLARAARPAHSDGPRPAPADDAPGR